MDRAACSRSFNGLEQAATDGEPSAAIEAIRLSNPTRLTSCHDPAAHPACQSK